MKFKDPFPGVVPPGAYRFYVGETDTEITASPYDVKQLKRLVRDHLKANGIERDEPEFTEWFEHELCAQLMLSSEYCEGADDAYKPKTIRIGDVVRFAKAVAKWTAKKFKCVPKEEAERRAKICASCPMNRPVRCLGCANIMPELMRVIGGRTTSMDKRLKSCMACSCALRAMVHLPGKILRDTSPEGAVYYEKCWKLEILNDG